MWPPASLLVLTTLAVSVSAAQQVRYVRPENTSPLSCPGQPCFTLYQYIYPNEPADYFTTGSTFEFLGGNHSLDFPVSLANVSDLAFRGRASNIGVNFICGDGVTIWFSNVTRLSIDGMRFVFTSSYRASFLVLINSAKVEITNVTFQGNGDLQKRSRAMYCKNSSVMVKYCLFKGSTGFTGGAMISYTSVISLYENTFTGNKAKRGGAIGVIGSILQVRDDIFISNKARFRGGAIYTVRSIVNITNSSFTQNKAYTKGGALFSAQSNVSLSCSLFTNEVAMRGGAVSADSANVVLTGNAFVNNRAKLRGGAMDVVRSSINLTNNSFVENAASMRGGAVYANESIIHLLGNYFIGNDVNISGSAIFASSSKVYRNESLRNVFERNRGGPGGPISCNNCGISLFNGRNRFRSTASKAYLAGLTYPTVGGIIPTPSIAAIYSNTKIPGDAFIGIIASPNETKVILTGNSTSGGDQYMLYSMMNPSVLSFFNRRRPNLIGGRNGFVTFGRTMKSDFNFFTNLGTAINSKCSCCSLELMGVGYFADNNKMPAYYYGA